MWPFKRKLYTCPCCGYKTLEAKSPGSYYICDICFWEDDPLQFEEPDFKGGANRVSLREGQRNFKEFGCHSREFLVNVRPPNRDDLRDPLWRPLE